MPTPEPRRLRSLPLVLLLTAACGFGLADAAGDGGGACEFSVARVGERYSFSLAAPTPAHRHGILSEDGFYRVVVNESVLWFQLCDEMIFNFDPPVCFNCEVPDKFILSGNCDYATTLRHPSGCARSVSGSGSGWGWLGILFITILCLLGGYILTGGIYRYYFLGIHSVEAIPNIEFWIGLPRRIKCNGKPA